MKTSDRQAPRDGALLGAAREYALRLLERPRTERQVRVALARRGFDGAVQEQVVARLRELRLLDDVAYARAYIEQALVRRPMGRRALVVALSRLGVSREHIGQALAQVEGGMVGATEGGGVTGGPGQAFSEGEEGGLEETAARRAARLWLRRNRGRVDPRRLHGYLVRRGFEGDLAARTVREVLGEEGGDAFPGGS
jgi:regulatory protein